MRRLIVSAFGTALVSVGLVIVGGSLVSAVWACEHVSDTGICLDEQIPADPVDPPADDDTDSQTSRQPPECHDIYSGEPTPCTHPNAGVYFPGENCYAYMLQPQPPAGDPLWRGHDPSEGSVWGCDADFANNGSTFFVAGVPPVVDAEQIARELIARAPFEVANVHMAPAWAHYTYIHLENWLWVPENQWHDVSVSLSANGATIALTATPSRLEVDMGDDASPLICRDAGRVWKKGMTDSAQTSCGYTYEKVSTVNASGKYDADGRFTATGRLYYDVRWTCTGRCSAASGDLGEFPAPEGESHEIEVRQRQTVVTN